MVRLRNNEKFMGRSHRRAGVIVVLFAAAVLVAACAGRAKDGGNSPQEAAEQVMHSIKGLDLETFNASTDNYEGFRWDFIGFTAVKEYKVFQDLLQPHIFEGKRYEEKRRISEKVVEGLTWEIGKVEEKDGGRKATVELTLTNKDIAQAIESYTAWLIEDITRDAGFGAVSLMKNIPSAMDGCGDDLIRFIDGTEEKRTENVTVTAYQEDGRWKLHLTQEFIDAFMGDMDSVFADEFADEFIGDMDPEAR